MTRPPRLAVAPNPPGRFRRDLVILRVHAVVLDSFRHHGLERPVTHVQRDLAMVQAGEERLGEVESCGRGRGRARPGSVHRLIGLAVPGIDLPPNVGRKRRPSHLLQDLLKISRRFEPDLADSRAGIVQHANRQQFGMNGQQVAGASPAARLEQGAPDVILECIQQQHLDSPSRLLDGRQPGGQHPGVVQHQEVPLRHEIGEVGEPGVLPGADLPADHHQPRTVAGRVGTLGDEAPRQLVVEIVQLQTASHYQSREPRRKGSHEE